ncbi:MAG: hypothetical protein ACFHXK_09970 [bacterium]
MNKSEGRLVMKRCFVTALVLVIACLSPIIKASEIEVKADNANLIAGGIEYSGNVAISLLRPESPIEVNAISTDVLGTKLTYKGGVQIKYGKTLISAETVSVETIGNTITYKMDTAIVTEI